VWYRVWRSSWTGLVLWRKGAGCLEKLGTVRDAREGGRILDAVDVGEGDASLLLDVYCSLSLGTAPSPKQVQWRVIPSSSYFTS